MPILLIGLGLVLALVATRHKASGGVEGGGGALVTCPADIPAGAWTKVGQYTDEGTKQPYDSNKVPWDVTAAQVGSTYFARAMATTGPYKGQCFAASMPLTASEQEAMGLGIKLHNAVRDYALAHPFSK